MLREPQSATALTLQLSRPQSSTPGMFRTLGASMSDSPRDTCTSVPERKEHLDW